MDDHEHVCASNFPYALALASRRSLVWPPQAAESFAEILSVAGAWNQKRLARMTDAATVARGVGLWGFAPRSLPVAAAHPAVFQLHHRDLLAVLRRCSRVPTLPSALARECPRRLHSGPATPRKPLASGCSKLQTALRHQPAAGHAARGGEELDRSIRWVR